MGLFRVSECYDVKRIVESKYSWILVYKQMSEKLGRNDKHYTQRDLGSDYSIVSRDGAEWVTFGDK